MNIYVYKADGMKKSDKIAFNYDALRFICALQGVLNRDKPVLFIDYRDKTDKFWLDYISGEGKFLHGRKFIELENIGEVIDTFADEITRCGLVLWDKNVPAIMNVAVTACGVSDYLPVCDDEFYGYLKSKLNNLEVRLNLIDKFAGICVAF